MALKDLVIDQDVLQEKLIESLVGSYIRYDVNQKSVVFLIENSQKLTIPQKIVIYLLALKGWKYFENLKDTREEAQPKDIATSIMENGSTTRSYLQMLFKKGIIQKNSMKYFIPLIALNRVQNYIQKGEE